MLMRCGGVLNVGVVCQHSVKGTLSNGVSALQVGTTMMSVIRTMPKCTHSWPVVSVAQRGEFLEWQSSRSVILHTLDGLQHKFSL